MATVYSSMGNYYSLYIYYTINSQDVDNNTSNVTIEWGVYKKASNSSTYNLDNTTLIAKANGTQYFSGNIAWDMRSSAVGTYKDYYTTTITVNHNSDGTANLALYGYINPGNVSAATNATIDTSVTLPTIPRASGITATNGLVNGTSTISISKKNAGYTSTISYKISGQNSFTTIMNKTADTSITWTIPNAAYNYMGASSKTVSITL